MTMENVISGFRTTEVYPINRAAVSIKTSVTSRMADLEAKKSITFPFIAHQDIHLQYIIPPSVLKRYYAFNNVMRKAII